MEVHVVPVDWTSNEAALKAIREEVFIKEQKVPREIEWDGEDDVARHFMAINEAGQRIGCGRLLPSGQIGRMAVLKPHRGQGVGGQILDAALQAATDLGCRRAFVHAQIGAVDFYRKAGFLPEGGEFMEAGIVHQAMAMELPIPFQAEPNLPRPEIRPEPAPPEAEAAELKQYTGEPECIEGLREALGWAHRTIRIYSQELDHTFFDRHDLIDVLSAFARRGPPARLLILIHSSGAIVSRGHRLVELARRLDSKVEIRTVPSELAVDDYSCAIIDEQGYFLMPDHRDYQAVANRYDPAQASRLAERFDYLWQRSEPDPELRVLRL